MSILLLLRFERNVNIYKSSSLKDFENVVFVSKSYFSKKQSVMKHLLNDMIMEQYLEKKLYFFFQPVTT